MRLSAADSRRVQDITAELARLQGSLSMERLVPEVGGLLGVEHPLSYQFDIRDGRVCITHTHGYRPAEVHNLVNRGLRSRPHGLFGYNPIAPKPEHRNKAFTVTPSWAQQFPIWQIVERLGLAEHYHLRALLCDGPLLLAWFGGFQPEEPTRRQHALLNRLAPAVGKRLRLERRIRNPELWAGALDVALDRLGGAAFLIGPKGALEHANAAGRARLERDGFDLVERLGRAVRGVDPDFEVHSLAVPGQRGKVLIERAPDETADRVRLAARRWSLTHRQSQVLELVARGHSNAVIAVELGIAVGTVEMHVSAILDRAEVDSRAALAAAVWSVSA